MNFKKMLKFFEYDEEEKLDYSTYEKSEAEFKKQQNSDLMEILQIIYPEELDRPKSERKFQIVSPAMKFKTVVDPFTNCYCDSRLEVFYLSPAEKFLKSRLQVYYFPNLDKYYGIAVFDDLDYWITLMIKNGSKPENIRILSIEPVWGSVLLKGEGKNFKFVDNSEDDTDKNVLFFPFQKLIKNVNYKVYDPKYTMKDFPELEL